MPVGRPAGHATAVAGRAGHAEGRNAGTEDRAGRIGGGCRRLVGDTAVLTVSGRLTRAGVVLHRRLWLCEPICRPVRVVVRWGTAGCHIAGNVASRTRIIR
jgi:hypothetical protein